MLKFQVYQEGRPATDWPLHNAHLVGADDVGVKGSVTFRDGLIICDKSAVGPAALVLQVEVEDLGDLMLQTCLLPEREEPYLLHLELTRHRIMRCIAKQEDWAMFDMGEDHPLTRRVGAAREQFVEALCAMDDPVEADRLAQRALTLAIDASEELALAHAEVMLGRRRQAGHFNRNIFGCGVHLGQEPEGKIAAALLNHFDYVRLPTPWRELEPEEQEYDWQRLDGWSEWASKHRLPIVAGPLVSFTPEVVPDWLYIWEHDYDTIRDLLYEHIERVATRYRGVVNLWNVVSGIHVNSHFTFNFEQLMDLTRMAVMLVQKIHPDGRTLIEITHPFGEYYAYNPQSIPPILYAEMVLQAGIPFDGFGLKLLMGHGGDGGWTRDLMQVSTLIDRFNGLGKPLHITAASAPSEPVVAPAERGSGGGPEGDSGGGGGGGYWRKPWSDVVQGRWLEAFYHVAMSKPFVESVAWMDLTDDEAGELPMGGLVSADLKPKSSLRRLAHLRKSLREGD